MQKRGSKIELERALIKWRIFVSVVSTVSSSICFGTLVVLAGLVPGADSYRWLICKRQTLTHCSERRRQSGGTNRRGSQGRLLSYV